MVPAKGGITFMAKVHAGEIRGNTKKLHDMLVQYDAGIIIGPAASHAWSIEKSSWETGADEFATIMKPKNFHDWRSVRF